MLEKILNLLENDNIFLTGGAGTGKSYLSVKIIKKYIKDKKKVAVLSSSALSALNIGGYTLHSYLGLGICNDLHELAAYDKKRKSALKFIYKNIAQCELMIIDEVSMISGSLFEMISYRLRQGGFKGRLMIVGDFSQLPPVIKKDQENSLLSELYAFNTKAWEGYKLKYLRLRISKRTDNVEFYEQLRHLRFGRINSKTLDYFSKKRIKKEKISDDYTILCAINAKVDAINNKRLAALAGKMHTFNGVENIKEAKYKDQVKNWIKSLNINESLQLKKGAKVIFCVNNKDEGYVNGEQGVVAGFEGEGLDESIIIEKKGEKIILNRYEYKLNSPLDAEDKRASFYQFPIKLAYAITMHKAQGMSIEKLVVDIDRIFENSQLYVALSRASRPENLAILCSCDDFEKYFKNIVKSNEEVYAFYEKEDFIDLE